MEAQNVSYRSHRSCGNAIWAVVSEPVSRWKRIVLSLLLVGAACACDALAQAELHIDDVGEEREAVVARLTERSELHQAFGKLRVI